MKNKFKLIIILTVVISILMFAGCSTEKSSNTSDLDRDVLFQVSLLQGLTFGDYYGNIPVAELEQHGDTGIGTFDGLNGELVMLDGEIYRVAGDGSIEIVPDDETVPFSNVTFMDADLTKNLTEIENYTALCNELDKIVEERGKNHFYMIRIDGLFNEVNLRSVYAQEEPYMPLVEVLEYDQTFFNYPDIEGTVVGLYCPPYMSDLNAAGWHFHFISKDKTKGGHVLGINFVDAVLTMDDTDAIQMILPDNEMFESFDLTVDKSADIKKVETNK